MHTVPYCRDLSAPAPSSQAPPQAVPGAGLTPQRHGPSFPRCKVRDTSKAYFSGQLKSNTGSVIITRSEGPWFDLPHVAR